MTTTKEDKKLKRRSLGGSRSWSSAGESTSVADDSVQRGHGSLGDLKRAVLGRAKSTGATTASTTESLAIELSEQPPPNFSSTSESKQQDKKDKKAAKKLKRRSTGGSPVNAVVAVDEQASTTVPCSTAPPDEQSQGRVPHRSQSYSEPTATAQQQDSSRSLSQGQRDRLDLHAVFARELRQLAHGQRENASQIAIMRVEVQKLSDMEVARQRIGIEDRIKQIDEDSTLCGCQCCGGLWDCLF
jgi:hypothetical protein